MKIEKAKKKEEAIARMKMLKLNPNIIQAFEEEDILHLSENGGFLYWLTDEQKSYVKEFEEQYDALVYHVIHDYTGFGELLAFLYVSDYKDEWQMERDELADGYACAYVKNVDDDCCSEIGGICFKPQHGGLVRTA